MASNYPTSLDSFTDPQAADKQNSPSHSSQHANINDAVEKVEAKLGADTSAVATSVDYFLKHASGTFRTHVHDGGSDDGAKLDWDTCWSDAVHSHASAAEGGALYVSRAFTWTIKGTLTVANEQGAKYIIPQNMTVTKIWAKTTSGTCTIRIQEGTGNVKASFAVTSSVGSSTSFDDSTIAAGNVLTLDITAISSGVDLFVTLEYKQLLLTS